eukprot:Hpha_TRINITY_DN16969_c2_g8::TRINITY_DN16969_c2_g8_i1::g.52073::m.52073
MELTGWSDADDVTPLDDYGVFPATESRRSSGLEQRTAKAAAAAPPPVPQIRRQRRADADPSAGKKTSPREPAVSKRSSPRVAAEPQPTSARVPKKTSPRAPPAEAPPVPLGPPQIPPPKTGPGAATASPPKRRPAAESATPSASEGSTAGGSVVPKKRMRLVRPPIVANNRLPAPLAAASARHRGDMPMACVQPTVIGIGLPDADGTDPLTHPRPLTDLNVLRPAPASTPSSVASRDRKLLPPQLKRRPLVTPRMFGTPSRVAAEAPSIIPSMTPTCEAKPPAALEKPVLPPLLPGDPHVAAREMDIARAGVQDLDVQKENLIRDLRKNEREERAMEQIVGELDDDGGPGVDPTLKDALRAAQRRRYHALQNQRQELSVLLSRVDAERQRLEDQQARLAEVTANAQMDNARRNSVKRVEYAEREIRQRERQAKRLQQLKEAEEEKVAKEVKAEEERRRRNKDWRKWREQRREREDERGKERTRILQEARQRLAEQLQFKLPRKPALGGARRQRRTGASPRSAKELLTVAKTLRSPRPPPDATSSLRPRVSPHASGVPSAGLSPQISAQGGNSPSKVGAGGMPPQLVRLDLKTAAFATGSSPSVGADMPRQSEPPPRHHRTAPEAVPLPSSRSDLSQPLYPSHAAPEAVALPMSSRSEPIAPAPRAAPEAVDLPLSSRSDVCAAVPPPQTLSPSCTEPRVAHPVPPPAPPPLVSARGTGAVTSLPLSARAPDGVTLPSSGRSVVTSAAPALDSARTPPAAATAAPDAVPLPLSARSTTSAAAAIISPHTRPLMAHGTPEANSVPSAPQDASPRTVAVDTSFAAVDPASPTSGVDSPVAAERRAREEAELLEKMAETERVETAGRVDVRTEWVNERAEVAHLYSVEMERLATLLAKRRTAACVVLQCFARVIAAKKEAARLRLRRSDQWHSTAALGEEQMQREATLMLQAAGRGWAGRRELKLKRPVTRGSPDRNWRAEEVPQSANVKAPSLPCKTAKTAHALPAPPGCLEVALSSPTVVHKVTNPGGALTPALPAESPAPEPEAEAENPPPPPAPVAEDTSAGEGEVVADPASAQVGEETEERGEGEEEEEKE